MKTKSETTKALIRHDGLWPLPLPSRDTTSARREFLVLCALGLLLLIICLAGCQQGAPNFPAASPTAGAVPHALMRLQEGDVVRISFEGDTNMNTVAKVQLDGLITVPLVGEVKASGKTPKELQGDLMRLYQRLLKVNEITVAIVSTAASVYVSGAVLRPGRIPMERPLTVLEAIMEAGGFDYTRAKLSEVAVLRVEDGQQHRYELNLKRTLKGTDVSPFYLKSYDVIYVPEKTFNF